MTRRAAGAKAGFTLIEALVALAIASVGLLALFSLQQQLIDGQRRYERALAGAAMKRNILAVLSGINPVERPSGELDLTPRQQLRWNSRPLTDYRRTTGLPAGDGAYQVRLYRINGEVVDGSGHILQALSLDRLGWRPLPRAPGGTGSAGGLTSLPAQEAAAPAP